MTDRRWHSHDFGAGRTHVHDHPDAKAGHNHAPCSVYVDDLGQRMFLPNGQRWPGEVTPLEELATAQLVARASCPCSCHVFGGSHVVACC